MEIKERYAMQDWNKEKNNFTNLISCNANAKEAFSDCEKFFDELTEWANKQTRYTYDKEDSTKNIKKSDSIPQCPGIYFAFEEEEKIMIGGNKEYYRIVRVGKSRNLYNRIVKNHMNGDEGSSSFISLIGKAMARKNNTYDLLLQWRNDGCKWEGNFRKKIRTYIRNNISFVCLNLKKPNNETNCLSCEKTRSRLELNFTKILAKSWDKNIPSEDWLGKFMPSVKALHNKLWCSVDDYICPCVPFPTKKEIDEMRKLLGIGESKPVSAAQ